MKTIEEVYIAMEESFKLNLKQIRMHVLNKYKNQFDDFMKCVNSYQFDKRYIETMEQSNNSFNIHIDFMKRMITSGDDTYTNADVDKQLENHCKSINHITKFTIKRMYMESLGYDYTHPHSKESELIARSFEANLLPYMFDGKKKYYLRAGKHASDTVEIYKQKLKAAIYAKLEPYKDVISEIEKLYIDITPKGLCGMFMITLSDGTYFRFKTECISAGGFNIQCLHYRYVTHILKK